MTRRSVLAIGLDPAFADFSAFPDLTPELVRAYVEAQIERLRDAGFDVDALLLEPGETAETEVETALAAKRYDGVVIGAGLRDAPDQLLLFERVINAVHALAPNARIAFNASPADTAEAMLRWLDP